MSPQVAAIESGKVGSLSVGRKRCVCGEGEKVRVVRRQVVVEEPRSHYGSCFYIAAKGTSVRKSKFTVPAHFRYKIYKVPTV
jgi:hypothetical protein